VLCLQFILQLPWNTVECSWSFQSLLFVVCKMLKMQHSRLTEFAIGGKLFGLAADQLVSGAPICSLTVLKFGTEGVAQKK
jgi:hypothetical protein